MATVFNSQDWWETTDDSERHIPLVDNEQNHKWKAAENSLAIYAFDVLLTLYKIMNT